MLAVVSKVMKDFEKIKKKVLDEVVQTSKTYVAREKVRVEFQQFIVDKLLSGSIKTEEDFHIFMQAVKEALVVYERIPFDNWKTIANMSR